MNRLAAKICQKMIEEAEELSIEYTRLKNGSHLIDTGKRADGGIQAGLYSVKICLGGIGTASLTSTEIDEARLPAVEVATDHPTLALLCQAMGGYREATAGWINFQVGSYRAIASGPARALVHQPKELFDTMGYKDYAEVAVAVLQSEQYPDERVADKLAERCKVNTENLYLVLCPLSSMAGTIQVIGRSIENAMLKLRTLNFNVKNVKYAHGIAPLPPLKSPEVTVDDMLSYGSTVHLYIMPDEGTNLEEIAEEIPSRNSECYGKPFTEILKEYGGFTRIDTRFFAPAEVYLNDLKTGKIHRTGAINSKLLKTMMAL